MKRGISCSSESDYTIEANNKKYCKGQEQALHEDAKNQCEAAGGQLPVIISQTDRETLRGMKDATHPNIWFGLTNDNKNAPVCQMDTCKDQGFYQLDGTKKYIDDAFIALFFTVFDCKGNNNDEDDNQDTCDTCFIYRMNDGSSKEKAVNEPCSEASFPFICEMATTTTTTAVTTLGTGTTGTGTTVAEKIGTGTTIAGSTGTGATVSETTGTGPNASGTTGTGPTASGTTGTGPTVSGITGVTFSTASGNQCCSCRQNVKKTSGTTIIGAKASGTTGTGTTEMGTTRTGTTVSKTTGTGTTGTGTTGIGTTVLGTTETGTTGTVTTAAGITGTGITIVGTTGTGTTVTDTTVVGTSVTIASRKRRQAKKTVTGVTGSEPSTGDCCSCSSTTTTAPTTTDPYSAHFNYQHQFKYVCTDPRKYVKEEDVDTEYAPYKFTQCKWNQKFDMDGTKLNCEINICAHPHNDSGGHLAPAPENNITLVHRDNWIVPFNTKIWYRCDPNTKIENDEMNPTKTNISVKCIADKGIYDIPEIWPNCTDTVVCGQPPPYPVETFPLPNTWTGSNRSMNGSITWLHDAPDLQDTYLTEVEYQCIQGSKFDTNDDGYGDADRIRTKCYWKKEWLPYPILPKCKITHCVESFPLPNDTNLYEITADVTTINQNKEYRCANSSTNGNPTRYWEKDRKKTTFSMLCLPNGTYAFENIRENWPTCLEGKIQK